MNWSNVLRTILGTNNTAKPVGTGVATIPSASQAMTRDFVTGQLVPQQGAFNHPIGATTPGVVGPLLEGSDVIAGMPQQWMQPAVSQPIGNNVPEDPYVMFLKNLSRRQDNRQNILKAYLGQVQKDSGGDFTPQLESVGSLGDAYLQSAAVMPQLQELIKQYGDYNANVRSNAGGGGLSSLTSLLSPEQKKKLGLSA